jgi:hypothetical protein
MVHLDPAIILLAIGDETLETTPEHPFYTLERGWINTIDLRFGDRVPQLNGEIEAVCWIEMVQRSQPMYNLTVAVAHTFFVGDEQWLVHNACRLDKNLGGTAGDKMQAHHIIPQEMRSRPFVQRASRGGWDHDGAANGVLLPDNLAASIADNIPYHNGSHGTYSNTVANSLNRLERAATQNNWSDAQSRRILTRYASTKRKEILNSGGNQRIR